MAQLSQLTKLFVRISDNLEEDDVRNLKALLSLEEILGKAKLQHATPLEVFDMLVDNHTIGEGNLGFLVDILKNLGKGKLADEAERLQQKQRLDEPGNTVGTSETAVTPEATMTQGLTTAVDSEREDEPTDGSPEDTKMMEPSGSSTPPDVHQVTSELASMDLPEFEQLWYEPMKRASFVGTNSSKGEREAKLRLKTLLAELNTSAVMDDKAHQFDLYCQVGDLYRTKLQDLQTALQYYHNLLECAHALSEDIQRAIAHNRLGLAYDLLGQHQEACGNHERALAICKGVTKRETDICVAYKNLATSQTLSGNTCDAKVNYESALSIAIKTENKPEQMEIYCKLSDLHCWKWLHDPQVSYRYSTEMLALARELGNEHMEGEAYGRLGLACVDMQDYEAALEWHQKTLKIKQDEGDKKQQIIVHTNVGETYRSLGKLDKATSHFNTALQLAQQTGDQHGQMGVFLWMGNMYREQLHSPRTAIKYYDQYLTLAGMLRDKREEGQAYSRLGLAHSEIGEHEMALEWHQKHLKMSQEDGNKKEQIAAHTNLGDTYRKLGRVDQATSHYNTVLQLAQETGNQRGQMNVNLKMGDMHRKQLHSPRDSIQYYEQHLALAKQLMDRSQVEAAYNRLGHAHLDMGEYETALEWYRKYLQMSQDGGNKKGEIIANTCVGDTYRLLGKIDQAKAHFNTTLEMAEQTGDQRGQMNIYFRMGDLHRKQLGSPQTSIKYYEQSLTLARQLMDRHKEGIACNRLGVAHYAMGEYGEALDWYHKNLKMNQETGDKTGQITAHNNIGDSYKAQRKQEFARSHYQSALAIAMETGNKQEQEVIAKHIKELMEV